MDAYPEDWEKVDFDKCFSFHRNNTCARAMMTDVGGSVRNIHYGDVLVKYDSVLSCAKYDVPFLTEDGVEMSPSDYLQNGDIVIADTAEDEASGKVAELCDVGNAKIVAGLHTVFCRPIDGEKFASGWLGYWMNSHGYHDQLIPLMTGIKVLSLSKASFRRTYVLVPPLAEQRRIAAALGDMDKLIDNLSKRIEKKKAIKQGAMQELLTGKKRLPGFEGCDDEGVVATQGGDAVCGCDDEGVVATQGTECVTTAPTPSEYGGWKKVRLGDCGDFIGGGTPSTSVSAFWGGDIDWYTPAEIGLSKYVKESERKITQAGLKNSAARLLPKGTILLTTRATLGLRAILQHDGATNQGFQSLAVNEFFDSEFMYYLLSTVVVEMENRASGSTFLEISASKLREIPILVPPTLAEQRAIAKVLGDMDAEIAKLEDKREKLIGIKKGMMSDLLTGKVRLKGGTE